MNFKLNRGRSISCDKNYDREKLSSKSRTRKYINDVKCYHCYKIEHYW
jgi:hypothetical protein